MLGEFTLLFQGRFYLDRVKSRRNPKAPPTNVLSCQKKTSMKLSINDQLSIMNISSPDYVSDRRKNKCSSTLDR